MKTKTSKTSKKAKKSTRKKKVIKPIVSLIEMEDVYRIINRVQLNKKEATFSVSRFTASIVKNVLDDLVLEYKIKELKTKVTFSIYPTWEEPEEEAIDIEVFDDEILEDGQLF